MCARYPTLTSPFWLTNALSPGGLAYYWFVPSDTSTPYARFTVNRLPGHPHFPYGLTVYPDDSA